MTSLTAKELRAVYSVEDRPLYAAWRADSGSRRRDRYPWRAIAQAHRPAMALAAELVFRRCPSVDQGDHCDLTAGHAGRHEHSSHVRWTADG